MIYSRTFGLPERENEYDLDTKSQIKLEIYYLKLRLETLHKYLKAFECKDRRIQSSR